MMSNPYLPKWEYIPDGEPRVFGDRVYVYGSHDVNSFFYFLKFRRLDPQAIEMVLLSFRLGGVYPECKAIQ